MHFDTMPNWVSLRIITSEFQMARTRAIYDWIFGLLPLPVNKSKYIVTYDAVDDNGALPDHALQSRRKKENASLASFRSSLAHLTDLAQAHDHIFRRHTAYTADGYLTKMVGGGAGKDSPRAPSYLDTY